MEKKILICGHRSFVATGLINKFKTAGIDFDCFSRGKEERNGNVVTGDVFLMHQNSELSENYDTVVNYILLKGKSVEENIQYCQSLLQFCKDKHVKNLIQISSISVYPNESLEVDETSAIEEDYHNKGGYASIKVAVDHYLMEHPIGGLQVSFVRPGYIYTKNQDISKAGILVSKFGLNILLGDKRTTLPLICREKIHEALLRIIQTDKKESVYLLLNKDKEEGTKYNFVTRQWNVKPICLPYFFLMIIAKGLKSIGIAKQHHYLKVVGLILLKQSKF